jgi:starch synthase
MSGADFLLMPSLYEPCGLAQMRAQLYGTVPVARRVGGLADTIDDGITGFLFDAYSPEALERAVERALKIYNQADEWQRLARRAMNRGFSWRHSTERYTQIYRRALAQRGVRQSTDIGAMNSECRL